MRKLIEVKGISEQKAQKLKELIKSQQLVSLGFQTASNKLQLMKDQISISTGLPIVPFPPFGNQISNSLDSCNRIK
jgi:hypothetical protein